jgi:FlgN protein
VSPATLAAREHDTHERALAGEVLEHLSAQILSARTLLEIVLEQGAAIRVRDVHNVVRLAGILRGEMGARALLEEERTRLLERSGELLGLAPTEITLAELSTLMEQPEAQRAAALSAELRGLLHELQREHTGNRALMQVELGFLDHLLGMLSLDGVSGYDPRGSSTSITRPRPGGALHVLDLRA